MGYKGRIGTLQEVTERGATSDQNISLSAEITVNQLKLRGGVGGSGRFVLDGLHTIADGDTTPSVSAGTSFQTINTGNCSISDFDDGVEGQVIVIYFADNWTTVVHGTNIYLSGGANKTFSIYDQLVLVNRGGKWFQIGGVI